MKRDNFYLGARWCFVGGNRVLVWAQMEPDEKCGSYSGLSDFWLGNGKRL